MQFSGTLIEAAKVGSVSKMLGRSKSEDSVCNSSANSSPVHGQVHVTYAQNSAQHYIPNGEPTAGNRHVNNHTPTHNPLHAGTFMKEHSSSLNSGSGNSVSSNGGGASHFFHTTTGKYIARPINIINIKLNTVKISKKLKQETTTRTYREIIKIMLF